MLITEKENETYNIWVRINGSISSLCLKKDLNASSFYQDNNININSIYFECSKRLNLDINKFKLLYAGKYLKYSYKTPENIKLNNNSTLDLVISLNGGNVLGDLIDGITQIGEFFAILPKILLWSISFTIWIWQFFIWFLIDFCNPVNLANDFIGGILKITRLLFAVISDAIFGITKYIFNTVLTPVFSGFWGWDNVLTPDEKDKIVKEAQNELNDTGSAHVGDIKIFDPPDGQVPFTVILATILMPPMGLFMEFGISGWVNIVICAVLTMAFYFPGLIYALLLIYS